MARQLFTGAPYARLFAEVRRRFEDAGDSAVRSVTLTALTDEERQALADLHGWKTLPAKRTSIRIDALDQALRSSSVALGLREVLEALGGPLVDRRSSAELHRKRIERMWSSAMEHPVVARLHLESWVTSLRASGALTRAAAAIDAQEQLLSQALAVVARLPAQNVLLSTLAAEAVGPPHALDPGTRLASIVLRAAARLAGWSDVPSSAVLRRRLWSAVGVVCDPLSVDVLTLGFRPRGASRLARHLCESSEDGEPRRTTLRELSRSTLALAATDVFVCENPAVVATAADRLGSRCAPLLCVDGIPSTAALTLLDLAASAGCRLHFRADFDWAGITIGNLLSARYRGSAPWQFDAATYRAAAVAIVETADLEGSPVQASWDGGLTPAMMGTGRVISEEHLLDQLLQDL